MNMKLPGRPRSKNSSGQLGIRLEPELVERLAAFCDACPIPVSYSTVVALAVQRFLDAVKDDPKNLFAK